MRVIQHDHRKMLELEEMGGFAHQLRKGDDACRSDTPGEQCAGASDCAKINALMNEESLFDHRIEITLADEPAQASVEQRWQKRIHSSSRRRAGGTNDEPR